MKSQMSDSNCLVSKSGLCASFSFCDEEPEGEDVAAVVTTLVGALNLSRGRLAEPAGDNTRLYHNSVSPRNEGESLPTIRIEGVH